VDQTETEIHRLQDGSLKRNKKSFEHHGPIPEPIDEVYSRPPLISPDTPPKFSSNSTSNCVKGVIVLHFTLTVKVHILFKGTQA